MWSTAALALLICMIGPFIKCTRGEPVSRLVGLQAANSMCAMILLVLCEVYKRVIFVDLALALALLSFGAELVFARFLERWL